MIIVQRTFTYLLLTLLIWPTVAYTARTGIGSWYSQEVCEMWTRRDHTDCPTASGKDLRDLEAAGTYFAASWQAPLGSRLRVCHMEEPDRCVVVTILDRGPARRLGRVIDLCKACFSLLAHPDEGIVPVTIERLE